MQRYNNQEQGNTETKDVHRLLHRLNQGCASIKVIHQLAKYRQFSKFDLRNAYHQIPICESDKQYTAFEAVGKSWEFNRVPFGVTNGVPVFQRLIDDVVEKDSLKDTFPYFDNVTIGGFSKEQHDKNVERFLESLRKRNLYC